MTDVDIAIIGAGAAGVAAARHVFQSGYSAVVLEAGTRVGGRAHTLGVRGLALDLGCGWLHSGERNVWREVAERRGIAVDHTPSAWREQFQGRGFSVDEEADAQQAWQVWSQRLEDEQYPSDRAAEALEPGGRWNNFLQAMSGYINGAALEELSVRDYLAYDRAASDTNWRLPDGYGALIAGSLPALPLHLATKIVSIDHRARLLRLDTDAGTITARSAIVTISSNMLAGEAIRFSPAIEGHMHAAACLPLGSANKLFFGIGSQAPFEPETHVIGNPHRADTGSYYIRPFGRPVIEAFFGGPGAARLERAGLAASFAFAQEELAGLFGHEVARSLTGLAGSAWATTDHIGGAYSHALPGQSLRRAELAEPVGERLFFAGEATHPCDFSTAHGAYATGARAAQQALAYLSKSQVPPIAVTERETDPEQQGRYQELQDQNGDKRA